MLPRPHLERRIQVASIAVIDHSRGDGCLRVNEWQAGRNGQPRNRPVIIPGGRPPLDATCNNLGADPPRMQPWSQADIQPTSDATWDLWIHPFLGEDPTLLGRRLGAKQT